MKTALKTGACRVAAKISGLYVHIPFCRRRCWYCDFATAPCRKETFEPYIDKVLSEANTAITGRRAAAISPRCSTYCSAKYPGSRCPGRVEFVSRPTLYFGGGTPTVLPDALWERTFAALDRLAPGGWGEVSVEANPESVSAGKLRMLRRLGVNRLSIGLQAAQDWCLKRMGRDHTAAQFGKCFESARQAGFDNISVDIIFALPGQTMSDWEKTLEFAVNLSPEHVSAYGLQIEDEAVIGRIKARQAKRGARGRSGEMKFCDQDLEAGMYETAIRRLKAAGYSHYEISNFAKPGRECRHNMVYWTDKNYLGIGLSAASHVGNRRWKNVSGLMEYLHGAPPAEDEILNRRQAASDRMFLGLRLLGGFKPAPADRRLFAGEINRLFTARLLSSQGSFLRLTRRGMMLYNRVAMEFL